MSESQGPGVTVIRLDVTQAAALRASCEAAVEAGVRCLLLLAEPGDGGGATAEAEPAWLVTLPLPVVFAFDGALDPGMYGVFLGADTRVCGPQASLTAPAAQGPWAAARLGRLLGDGGAGRVRPGAFHAGATTATEMLALGLVSAVAPDHVAEGARLAAVIASRGPIATALGKEAIWRGLELNLEQALRLETDLTLLLQTTKDRAEGVRAFTGKRPPRFTGD
jgi:enoyl-CoA hydratase/carnithine racemase